ncbi:hypothetical protein TIFTF001_003077 [Ficus carica]|uniref:Uncharacterized protein n=1 Tax=Ficus carica TaxID=3494 RepID=A0AA88CUQ9_FICCA|nr:hypothetical protein TIFTF001_003077 [Ficus carica]
MARLTAMAPAERVEEEAEEVF